jgi:hypothetical protein
MLTISLSPELEMKVSETPIPIEISLKVKHMLSCPKVNATNCSNVLYLLQPLSLLCAYAQGVSIQEGTMSKIWRVTGVFVLIVRWKSRTKIILVYKPK